MRICIAGGAGYVGSSLVLSLLEEGHFVTVLDLFLYGKEVFEKVHAHERLTLIEGDVRDLAKVKQALHNVDVVIHLACISNDPSFELNPKLGKSINLDAFEPFVLVAKQMGIERFIYASSSSVYGVKSEKDVTEEISLEPLTDYSKYKALCEEILFRHQSPEFVCTIIRPATVCGYSPRQRLDVIVNILTNHAYHKGKISVMGGEQLRPNIHIQDMVDAYLALLYAPAKLIAGEVFNAGYHNHSVLNLGKIVQKAVCQKRDVDLEIIPTNDYRSYHISSEKIRNILGFTPKYSIENAVQDLVAAFSKGLLPCSLEDARYFNIRRMKEVHLK